MTIRKLFTLAIAILSVIGLTGTAWGKGYNMKMTTPIPVEITTPDRVESRLGTLYFKNSMPDQATIDKVYDHLDFSRAVDVYLNTLSGVMTKGSLTSWQDFEKNNNGSDTHVCRSTGRGCLLLKKFSRIKCISPATDGPGHDRLFAVVVTDSMMLS
ncbi:MAG: hypothetical protein KAU22_05495 [Desulfuromonadales bacterium]|nr:hypothetical protein [Desulfuromonadales bacterium]